MGTAKVAAAVVVAAVAPQIEQRVDLVVVLVQLVLLRLA